jgi:hypothetical protein
MGARGGVSGTKKRRRRPPAPGIRTGAVSVIEAGTVRPENVFKRRNPSTLIHAHGVPNIASLSSAAMNPPTRIRATSEQPLPADPMIGVVLEGRYRLLEAIGRGGASVVYRAEQLTVARELDRF